MHEIDQKNSKDIYDVTILFKINAVLLNFLFIKNQLKKCITISTKIFSNITVYNIDNNKKCFLSDKSY